ncbi:MAG: methyltransferase [Deltaproteobacteria bacterium]
MPVHLDTFGWLVLLEIALAVPTLLSLVFIPAPYGRHERKGWGPTLPARLGWILMESPAVWWFVLVYFQGPRALEPVPLVFLAMWQLHYVYRSFVFPFLLRAEGRRMPLMVPVMAILFNLLNNYVNAHWISALGVYPVGWLSSWQFLLGTALFLGGFALNVTSDRTLRHLRAPGETGYKIPRGGAFELVTAPNYLGEILEWTGWAIATWSPAGLAFAIYTFANLAPRALSHHRWYRERFPDYPADRKALVPFLL